MPFKIEGITAFVAVDKDGDEGIMAYQNPLNGTWMPLVCADEKRVRSMYPMAVSISEAKGTEFRVLQFLVRVDITDDVKDKFGK